MKIKTIEVSYACGHKGVIESACKRKHVEYQKDKAKEKLCPKCFQESKKKQLNIDKKKGLKFIVEYKPLLNRAGEELVDIFFKGNTISCAELLRKRGFTWQMEHRRFIKRVVLSELEDNKEKALFLKADIIEKDLHNKEIVSQIKAEDSMHYETLARVKKPKKPELLESGLYWNEKIYGRLDNFFVFLGGDRQPISNGTKKELEMYLVDVDNYNDQINSIWQQRSIRACFGK